MGLGVANVISGLENVIQIFVGAVMLVKFLIRLIWPKNGMVRSSRVDVPMFVFRGG